MARIVVVRPMSTHELTFMRHLLLALGRHRDLRLWRQNVGHVPVRDRAGRVARVFNAGPPKGAADLSGYVRPEGWRLEIEVKGDATALRPEQAIFARNVTSGGCVYVVVRYEDANSLDDNLTNAVRLVERAIAERRAACR
jgi:hypothetical protein